MRVSVILEVTDEQRRALAAHWGLKGLASSSEIETWAHGLIDATLEDIEGDFMRSQTP